MKFSIFFLVVLAICLTPAVHGAESEVIRIFDENLRLTKKEMTQLLKQADLEKYGFKKTVEISTEIDKYGEKKVKKTMYFRVTDDCSRVRLWEGILEQRMPKKLMGSNIFSKTVTEVESRIAGRTTKSCTVGLEVHFNRCSKKTSNNNVSKRGVRGCGVCIFCSSAALVYGS